MAIAAFFFPEQVQPKGKGYHYCILGFLAVCVFLSFFLFYKKKRRNLEFDPSEGPWPLEENKLGLERNHGLV
jgi:hypothetical protein